MIGLDMVELCDQFYIVYFNHKREYFYVQHAMHTNGNYKYLKQSRKVSGVGS